MNYLENTLRLGLNHIGGVYDRHVRADDVIVVVGPSLPYADPTLMHIASHIPDSNTLFVADPQSSERMTLRKTKAIDPMVGGIQGVGDITEYLDYLALLRAHGAPVARPHWLGNVSGVHNIPLKDGSANRIFDHETGIFVAREAGGEETGLSEDSLLRTLHEYRRALVRGGEVLLSTRCDPFGFVPLLSQKFLKSLFEATGYSVTHQHVEDVYGMVIPEDLVPTRVTGGHIEKMIQQKGKMWLKIRPMYQCTDMFIGTKL